MDDNNSDSESNASGKEHTSSESPVKIKEEPPDSQDHDIKDYAETTMNELLGWYGYDKVNSEDTEHLNLQKYTSSGVDDENSPVNDISRDDDSLDEDDDDIDDDDSLSGRSGFSLLSRSNSETSLAAQHRSLVTALTQKHGLTGAPDGTLPSGYIVCAWCQKPGVKLFTQRTPTTTKAFCSEVCFTQCRRASFKKNKVCDWCKHVRHTVNYVDFQDGEQQLQFCSPKCLNQYKMKIFCKETQEHLKQIKGQTENGPTSVTSSPDKNNILITPELWMKDSDISESKRKESKRSRSADCKDKLDKFDKDKMKVTNVKSEWKKESNRDLHHRDLNKSTTYMSDNGEDNEKRRSRMARLHDKPRSKEHHHSSRKDASGITSPQSVSSEPSPPIASQGSNSNSLLFSNTGFQSMGQWMPPQFWNAFGPGMPPMGPLPPWYYPGFAAPVQGMVPNAPSIQTHLEGASANAARNGVPTPNRSLLSPNVNISPSRSPNTNSSTRPPKCSPGSESSTRNVENHPHFSNLEQFQVFQRTMNQNLGGSNVNGAQETVGSGGMVPPVTMIMPVPVAFPMPIPIPLPLPLKMEQIMEVFNKKKDEERMKSDLKETVSPKVDVKNEKQVDLNIVTHSNLFQRHDINENEHKRRDCNSRTSVYSDRSGSVVSCPDLSDHFSSPRDLTTRKRPLTPKLDGSLDLSKRYRPTVTPSPDSCDGVIDLSKDSSIGKYKMSPGKENRDNNESESSRDDRETDSVIGEEEGSNLKVPRIHIITPTSEPPLSQQLPLPPSEHKYSSRRGLILDAPSVPKRPRSPSPERRSYVRSVPRDVMEAARRRCLRARIRTK